MGSLAFTRAGSYLAEFRHSNYILHQLNQALRKLVTLPMSRLQPITWHFFCLNLKFLKKHLCPGLLQPEQCTNTLQGLVKFKSGTMECKIWPRARVKVADCSSVGDTGPKAPAPHYTPLALILLFWETSAAALACQSKVTSEFKPCYPLKLHQSVLESHLIMNLSIFTISNSVHKFCGVKYGWKTQRTLLWKCFSVKTPY